MNQGSDSFLWPRPLDEWDALSLNYTSGTTGNPKGVVSAHRGVYLTALSNVFAFDGMPSRRTRYLWTVPLFHANGWNFAYTLAVMGGVSYCLRSVSAASIGEMLTKYDITHMSGAPIVVRFATEAMEKLPGKKRVKMMCAGAPPPPATLRAAVNAGVDVVHVYGMTEVHGPQTWCEWNPEWDALDETERAVKMARQGVEYPTCDGLDVLAIEDSPTGFKTSNIPVPRDGETLGEVVFRGNAVMKGYLKNDKANAEVFQGDYFRSGDIAVFHPDGHIKVKDRAKDIVISGGENISSQEVEAVIMEHPDVIECAVVPRPDPKWGEHPCCFVEIKPGSSLDEAELLAFARTKLVGFKRPKSVVFGPLAKTVTGKIQKFILRQRLNDLPPFQG